MPSSSSSPSLLYVPTQLHAHARRARNCTGLLTARVSQNPKGRELAWQFVQKNFDALAKKYEGGFLLGHLVRVPQHFASDEKAAEVEKFYGSKNLPGVERTVRQAVESIRSNAKWLHRDQETIHKWLQAHAHFA